MFDETSFSLDAFDQDAWLFLLDVPYFDLTGKQRIYVRAVVNCVYLSSEAEKIISFAGANNLSVLDAAVALRVNAEPLQIIATQKKNRRAPQPVVEKRVREPKTQERRNKPAYVVAAQNTLAVSDQSDALIASYESQQIVASSASQHLFVRTGKES